MISVSESFGGLPNKELGSGVSQWWRERVQHLIDCGRAEDARCLYLEFGEDSASAGFLKIAHKKGGFPRPSRSRRITPHRGNAIVTC